MSVKKAIVKESDARAMLTVPVSSLSELEYEEAIAAIAERMQYGNGKAINRAGTLMVIGQKPNRLWTNHKEYGDIPEFIEWKKHMDTMKNEVVQSIEEKKEESSEIESLKAQIAALTEAMNANSSLKQEDPKKAGRIK